MSPGKQCTTSPPRRQPSHSIRGDGELCFRHSLRGGATGGRFGNEFAIASTYVHACRVTGVAMRPRRVWFAHPAPKSPASIAAFFQVDELDFDRAESGIALSEEDALRPLLRSDPRLMRTADEIATGALAEHSTDLIAMVRQTVRASLSNGDVDAIAKSLHMSGRSLQRKLHALGTSFVAVRNDLRREVALQLLDDPGRPLADIAAETGFRDLASFSRAFKRWTGKPPGAYRDGLREP